MSGLDTDIITYEDVLDDLGKRIKSAEELDDVELVQIYGRCLSYTVMFDKDRWLARGVTRSVYTNVPNFDCFQSLLGVHTYRVGTYEPNYYKWR